jgi:hypothetical protein
MGRLSRLMGVEASRVRAVGVAMVLALRQAYEKEPNQAMETMMRKSWTTGVWTRSQYSIESAERLSTEDLPHSRISAAPKASHLFFHPPFRLPTFILSLSFLGAQ